jgi:hypothetical protein
MGLLLGQWPVVNAPSARSTWVPVRTSRKTNSDLVLRSIMGLGGTNPERASHVADEMSATTDGVGNPLSVFPRNMAISCHQCTRTSIAKDSPRDDELPTDSCEVLGANRQALRTRALPEARRIKSPVRFTT